MQGIDSYCVLSLDLFKYFARELYANGTIRVAERKNTWRPRPACGGTIPKAVGQARGLAQHRSCFGAGAGCKGGG